MFSSLVTSFSRESAGALSARAGSRLARRGAVRGRLCILRGGAPACRLPLWVGLAACLLSGCKEAADSQPAAPGPATAATESKVIAQGQILPANGFIQLSAPPGDVVEKVFVQVGEQVKQGQTLLEMRSEHVTAAQLETLRKRRQEAVRERDNAIAAANQKLNAAKLKLQQLDAQQTALGRQKKLLEQAQNQVQASRQVLNKLESISQDSVTREFVGQLEIDRQRIAVGDAELNYQHQVETQQQAEEDIHWAQVAAQEELTAAQSVLNAAQASQAVEILDLELKALETQEAAAKIVAPTSGVILALNAMPGEASVQLPLVEMANIERLVCEVEINEMDAARVEPNQPATLTSRAFGDQQLTGQVTNKFRLVGRPQLRPLDPLARVDYRTVTAVIELDPQSVEMAQDWLQLQVQVEIDTSGDAVYQPSSEVAAQPQ